VNVRLATTRPWVVEAFDHIASTVHQEKGSAHLPRGLSHLFSPDMFGGDDDEDMEDGENSASGAAGVRQITREQLAAALDSLNAIGSASFGGQRASQSPAGPPASLATMASLLGLGRGSGSNASPATTSTSSVPATGSSGNSFPGFPSTLSSLLPQTSGAGSSVTPDMVARAMNEAIQRLPADQRAQQFNAIRSKPQDIFFRKWTP